MTRISPRFGNHFSTATLVLSGEVRAALALPAVQERICKGAAAEPSATPTSEGQLRIFASEKKSWAEAAQIANFKAP